MAIIPPNPDSYDELGRPLFTPVPKQVQQPQIPSIQYAPVMPVPVTPTTTEQQAMQTAPPDINAYHRSKLRTVLDAIAGGLAGAAGGPKAGIETGYQLRNAAYLQDLEKYQNTTADQKRKLDIEKEQERRSEFPVIEGGKLFQAKSLDVSRAAQAEAALTRAQTGQAEHESKDLRRRALTENEQKKLAKLPPNLQAAVDLTQMPEDQQDAVVEALRKINPKETTAEKTQAAIDVKSTPENLEKQAKTSRAVGYAGASGRVAADTSPEAIRGRAAQAEAIQDVKTTPEAIARQAALTRARSLATLTTNEKDTIRGAQVALQAFPDIREQLPTASDKIFGNRWQEFLTGTLGHDPEFAPLRENLGLLQSLVAKLHVGSRGSVHILNKFETLFNAKEMDRDTLNSSLNELEKWLIRYAKAPGGTSPDDVHDDIDWSKIKVVK